VHLVEEEHLEKMKKKKKQPQIIWKDAPLPEVCEMKI